MTEETKEYRNGQPLKLIEVSMGPQEKALEAAYIANHPWMAPGQFDHSWMTSEELIESLETIHERNLQSKNLITPSEYAQQMTDYVKRKRETLS